MTIPDPSFSVEMLTLPNEDPREHAQLFQEWMAAYSDPSPIEAGLIAQAVFALMELRRLARVRTTLRRQKVRTAVLDLERAQEDNVATWLDRFNDHPPSALVGLLRSASGCRKAIATLERLALELRDEGTWYGLSRHDAVLIQGKSACIDELYFSLEAFTTWADSVACQANPKQKDIDVILDRRNIPKALVEKDVQVWPRDPAACRARMQALVDKELPRLKALEAALRVAQEEPERAEAQVMALASVTKDERQLLRDQRLHEQSYLQASTALAKLRRQSTAARGAAQGRVDASEPKRTRRQINPWYPQPRRGGRKTGVVRTTQRRSFDGGIPGGVRILEADGGVSGCSSEKC